MTNTAWHHVTKSSPGQEIYLHKTIYFYRHELVTEENKDSRMRKYVPYEAHTEILCQL